MRNVTGIAPDGKRLTLTQFSPNCYRVERDGITVGRFTTNYADQVQWHCVYAAAGMDATLDTLLDMIAHVQDPPDPFDVQADWDECHGEEN